MATGTATLNFGAFPGASDASVDVATGGVVSTSRVEAWIQPAASADHSADEHMVETLKVFGLYLSDGNIRIRGFNTGQLNEPLEPMRGATVPLLGALTDAPSVQLPRVGGRGTRLYGAWTVAWAWV